MRTKEELLQSVVAQTRGIPLDKVSDTLSFLVIRDHLDSDDWAAFVDPQSEERVLNELKTEVVEFLQKSGDQIGKM